MESYLSRVWCGDQNFAVLASDYFYFLLSLSALLGSAGLRLLEHCWSAALLDLKNAEDFNQAEIQWWQSFSIRDGAPERTEIYYPSFYMAHDSH